MNRAVLASQNKGKLREMRTILKKFDMDVVTRDAAGIPGFEIEETGDTFEENSYIKAKAIYKYCGMTTIADDSGLMVDALGGQPGVYSARFSDPNATPERNNEKLLHMMKAVPDNRRTATFVSVITMIFQDGSMLTARGECEGVIAQKPTGSEGFGYDPLFIPNGYNISFGKMNAEIKNSISHRAKALLKLEELIREKQTEDK